MAIEALETIALAEENARQIRSAAGTDVKKALRESEDAAAAMLAAALEKADEEVREMTRRADEKAKEGAAALASTTRNREAAMKAHAEKRMDEVAARIVERIVNG